MITLKTLPTATAQEVFDQVAHHLLTQGVKSVLPSGRCAYRGDNNRSCAAGCLISDDEYSPDFEGYSWSRNARILELQGTHEVLITRLQGIHDQVPEPDWGRRLRSVAKEFNLEWKFDQC